jgi:hypothetical protein
MASSTRTNPSGILEPSEWIQTIHRPDASTLAQDGNRVLPAQARNRQTKTGIDVSQASSAEPLGKPIIQPLAKS